MVDRIYKIDNLFRRQWRIQQIRFICHNLGYHKFDFLGPANPNLASQNDHRKDYVMFVRKFIEAVIEYTKAD